MSIYCSDILDFFSYEIKLYQKFSKLQNYSVHDRMVNIVKVWQIKSKYGRYGKYIIETIQIKKIIYFELQIIQGNIQSNYVANSSYTS